VLCAQLSANGAARLQDLDRCENSGCHTAIHGNHDEMQPLAATGPFRTIRGASCTQSPPSIAAQYVVTGGRRMTVKTRTVAGIIGGLISWWVAFLLTLALMANLWPGFGAAGAQVQATGDYSSLTPAMLAVLLASYVLINGIAGWTTVRIARQRWAVWITCAPILAYAANQHLNVLWNDLPAWYNLGVVGFIYPFGLAGGALAPASENDLSR
jgi:hypothetical protein